MFRSLIWQGNLSNYYFFCLHSLLGIKAAAADAEPAAPITGAGIEMARAKMGNTGGAKSKRVGKSQSRCHDRIITVS